MRILVITTAVFALTTTYFARELWREGSRAAPGFPPQSASPLRGIVNDAVAPRIATGVAASAPTIAACPDPARLAAAREQLDRYAQPAQRQEMVDTSRAGLRSQWQLIAMSMQVPEAELAPLVDRLAEQSVRFSLASAECRARAECPPCDVRALDATFRESRLQEIANYLGPERMQRYEAWRFATRERVFIDELRKRLAGADALGDAEAERFVLELAERRRQFIDEAARQGKRVEVSLAGFTVQEFQGDAPPKPFGPSNRDLTTQFNEQLRQLATQRLKPAQVEAFRKMQDERLANARLMEQLAR
jgi:hypothetical protein